MRLSDLKPRIKLQGGAWRCTFWQDKCEGVGGTPAEAYRRWQDARPVLPARPLDDYPLLPRFYPQEPPRVRPGYWGDWPPGTILCGSPHH